MFISCLTGLYGGDPAPKADHHCSENGRVGAPDWAPLLCTVELRPGKTDPYLGLFYQTEPLISSDGDYPVSAAEYSYRFVRSFYSTRLCSLQKSYNLLRINLYAASVRVVV